MVIKANNILFLTFIFICKLQSLNAQYFTVNDILKIKNLKDAEEMMYNKGLRNIERKQNYIYSELLKLKLNKSDTLNCGWTYPMVGKINTSSFKLLKIPYKNYEEKFYIYNNFAWNYNSAKNTASTFIEVTFSISSANNNCENVITKKPEILSFDFQFYDKDEFEYFFREIRNNSNYKGTETIYPQTPTAVYWLLKEESKNTNDNNRFDGIKFFIRENDDWGFVTFKLDL